MIIKNILKNFNTSFSNKQLDGIILLAHAIKKPKEFIYAHPEYRLTWREKLRLAFYKHLLKRGWPVAYITKHKEFCGLDFYINRHVLIPRSETELVVEEVKKLINNEQLTTNKLIIVDIGTGTGCIPISINKLLNKTTNKQITTYATDISGLALRVAKKNAKRHQIKIIFLRGDLLNALSKTFNFTTLRLYNSLIITANLPYLTYQQFKDSPTIQHEPRQALIADNIDGLSLYKNLLLQIQKLIACDLQLATFLEIDPRQSASITKLIKKYLPLANIEIKKDLAGRDRVVVIKL